MTTEQRDMCGFLARHGGTLTPTGQAAIRAALARIEALEAKAHSVGNELGTLRQMACYLIAGDIVGAKCEALAWDEARAALAALGDDHA
jgi:hypothetical protein